MLLLLGPAAYASSSITGTATRCSGLASCYYTMTGTGGGTGYAMTSAGVGGYVGQSPLYFSGGYIQFKLPGETATTYAYGVYSGQAVLIGWTSAGTTYHITGTFKALDANTGTIVTGSTDGVVGIKGHSGRGGGNTYTLVKGSITFVPSTTRASTTSLSCNPSSLMPGQSTTCTVTVSDPGTGPKTPTGQVTFSESGDSTGTFSPSNVCTLSSGTCAVTFTTDCNAYNVVVTASYPGDGVHAASSASKTIYISNDC